MKPPAETRRKMEKPYHVDRKYSPIYPKKQLADIKFPSMKTGVDTITESSFDDADFNLYFDFNV
jgi:hypothetical protein